MEQAVGLSALGALLALDNAMVGQFMLGQPLVVGGVFGLLLGNLPAGLLLGAMVQLIWISILPVGAYVPSDYTVTGGISIALAIVLAQQPGMSLGPGLVLALAVAIPAGFFSGKLDIMVRHFNSRIAGKGERVAEKWGPTGIDLLNLLGLIPAFLRNFIIYFIWLGPLAVFIKLLPQYFPAAIIHGLGVVFWVLPLLSLAVILEMVAKEKAVWLLATSFFLTWILRLFIPGQGLSIFIGVLLAGAMFIWWRRSW